MNRSYIPPFALCLLLTGCNAVIPSVTTCDTDATCSEAFGPGSLCQPSGLCSEVEKHPRCTRTYPTDFFDNPSAYKDAIVLGALYDYQAHRDTLQATELAIREVTSNEQNGLDGQRSYVLVTCDYGENKYSDGLDSLDAASATATYLSKTFKVPAIMGPRGSSRTKVTFQAVKDDGVLVISPSATSPELTALEGNAPTDNNPGLLWRTAPPDSLQGRVIAEDMINRAALTGDAHMPPKKVAIVYQVGAYGDGLKDVFIKELNKLDDSIETQLFSYSSDSEFDAAVAMSANADGIDEFLFITSEIGESVNYLKAMKRINKLGDRFIFLTDSSFNKKLLEQAADARDLFGNIRGTRPARASGTIFDTFLTSYQRVYNEDASTASAFTPHAYDATWLVLYGTAWAQFQEDGKITGKNIARGLRKISSGEEFSISPNNWTRVIQSFRSGTSFDVVGASGTLNYNPMTEETASPIDVWVINGNDFETSYTVEP